MAIRERPATAALYAIKTARPRDTHFSSRLRKALKNKSRPKSKKAFRANRSAPGIEPNLSKSI
jgi:hypothetical protein